MERPDTQFADGPEGKVAFQVFGDGPDDLLFVPPWLWNIDAMWEQPLIERYLETLASFSRVIVFDKRGTGVSDPVPVSAIPADGSASLPTLEQWTDDLRVVMDAAGSERAAVVGNVEGAQMAILFAATYPQRTSALVVFNGAACYRRHADYPAGIRDEQLAPAATNLFDPDGQVGVWGLPSLAGDQRFRAWLARFGRLSVPPSMGVQMFRHGSRWDVRAALASIQVPTLVLHHKDNGYLRVEHAHYLAEHIQDAQLVELDGPDAVFFASCQDESLTEIAAFIGHRDTMVFDRVLATVLFTDVVESTELAASLGDRAWRTRLDAHDRIAAQQVERHRGKLIKTTGDGVLATFDGPARAIRCARALTAELAAVDLVVRSGLHTGEVDLRGDDIGGLAVNLAARVAGIAGPGETLVSSTVKDLVIGSGIEFLDRGTRALKGIPGRWRLHSVV